MVNAFSAWTFSVCVCVCVCVRMLVYSEFCITGIAVALHCCKVHVQSQWERANFDPHWPQMLWNFQIRTWRPWLRPSDLHQCKYSFHSQIGEIIGFVTFFLVGYTVFFFLRTCQGWTRGWIFTYYGSYNVFSPRTVLFGAATILEFIWVISPKLPKMRCE